VEKTLRSITAEILGTHVALGLVPSVVNLKVGAGTALPPKCISAVERHLAALLPSFALEVLLDTRAPACAAPAAAARARSDSEAR
jgi:hypothetical protein